MGRIKSSCNQYKKELRILADGFCFLHRADIQEIIENCKNYDEGQREIMKVYTSVYM